MHPFSHIRRAMLLGAVVLSLAAMLLVAAACTTESEPAAVDDRSATEAAASDDPTEETAAAPETAAEVGAAPAATDTRTPSPATLEDGRVTLTPSAPQAAAFAFESDLLARLTDRLWSIEVRFRPDAATESRAESSAASDRGYTFGSIRFEADGRSRVFNLVLTAGNRVLYFGEGFLGFIPQRVEIEVEDGMEIERLTVLPTGYVGRDTIYPAIPADLGVINYYDQRSWRHPRFELFAWNVTDNVLIFDFADLDIQRDMFGRLGFFVAVAGEAGEIFPEEYYEGRHTYNAHDYRPEDLAPFFTIAEETGVGLNEREEFLRDLMLDYGIIHRDDEAGGYRPGSGAVLSFSRATWRPLRQRLLRHEAMHGVFYVSERFREGAFALWEQMSPLEQEYWRLFLGNKGRMDGREGYDGYDVDRLYLLVNEMQAHVLQLHPHEVNPYFRDFYAGRIREVVPESAQVVNELLATEPHVFVNTRRALEELLEEVTGIRGGYLMAVYPEEVEILHR